MRRAGTTRSSPFPRRTRAWRTSRTSTTSRSSTGWRSSTSSRPTRTSSPASRSRAPSGSAARKPRRRSSPRSSVPRTSPRTTEPTSPTAVHLLRGVPPSVVAAPDDRTSAVRIGRLLEPVRDLAAEADDQRGFDQQSADAHRGPDHAWHLSREADAGPPWWAPRGPPRLTPRGRVGRKTTLVLRPHAAHGVDRYPGRGRAQPRSRPRPSQRPRRRLSGPVLVDEPAGVDESRLSESNRRPSHYE